ncbi:MurR/RpiR family transcriptional regulator [Pseudooceanicola sediminis]|uniref:MurR/RpiR family transcriptional regulator n=1 Tax=Pseudooceanicola sediminis TaxID=2211117 RepID=A0A399J7D4_9RHOB|nr:MurR/RpiR family transcriptional regulator [Pseudooceanicola sediminis]KAA2314241.1 MurR/RpiR family transcriptional regulator [Puniceibacterium sp. HSS470]RII39902.1 MurR/RpiR family transcriptional regulator [Pseudooceanicola sediminis]|tara:strand:+ start:53773 stop:54621 length:849 start_codon:yes stop_codon:yes gene_type:complete
MASRLILRIHEKQQRLTGSEQKIAKVLLENQGLIETHTATELASFAGVSKATTARFFRTLGYTDFEEVRLQAREERNSLEPYRKTETHPDPTILGRSIGDHLDLEIANLTRTFEELRSDRLPEIADIIAAAPRVWFLGFGAEDGAARLGKVLFSRLRHGVRQLEGAGQDWASDLAVIGPRDVLILLTLEPRPRMLRALLAYARTSRMRIVTLTDHGFMAQAERFSEAVLPCHVSSFGILPTHATLLSMLRLLAIAYIGKNPEAVKQRADTLDAINEELDLFE